MNRGRCQKFRYTYLENGQSSVFRESCDYIKNFENKDPDYAQSCLVDLFKKISSVFKFW